MSRKKPKEFVADVGFDDFDDVGFNEKRGMVD